MLQRIAFVACAVAATSAHAVPGSLADSNGEVVAWGFNLQGQTFVPPGSYTAIDAGNNYSLAIRADGTLAAWGGNEDGQLAVPPGVYRAISAGLGFGLALRSDGVVKGWGLNTSNQTTPPFPDDRFIAVAAGGNWTLALRGDYLLERWGGALPAPLPEGQFKAISGGAAIRPDDTVELWGYPALTDPTGAFRQIDDSLVHGVGIRTDGTLAAWGTSQAGQATPPAGEFLDAAAGFGFNFGVRANGSLVHWGGQAFGVELVPEGVFVEVAAGFGHGLALRARREYDGDLLIAGVGAASSLNRSIRVAGDATVSGPAKLYNNPVMDVGGRLIIAPGASFVGQGAIIAHGIEMRTNWAIPSTLAVTNAGALSGTGNLTLSSGVTLDAIMSAAGPYSGTITVSPAATLAFRGVGAQTAGGLVVSNGGELRLSGGERFRISGAASNAGRIELVGSSLAGFAELEFLTATTNSPSTGFITGQFSSLRFAGGLNNSGSLALTSGLNNVTGDVTNLAGGKIDVTGGASAVFYDDVVQNGALTVRRVGLTGSSAVFLGSFTGSGGSSGGGDIFFDGDLRPGNSPAAVSFANNVGLGGNAVTRIELAGPAVGAQYDKIIVGGALSLDGALDVSLLGGYMPVAGAAFDILDWGSLSGSFASISLPALATNLAWNATQLYSTGALKISYAGDFDVDGDVDGADLLVWQRGGSPTPSSAADLAAWRVNFGAAASVVATDAVPEPTSLTLILLAAVAARRLQ